jgi:hypothetical protein
MFAAAMAFAAEERGPAVRQGGQIGELRTFFASGLSGQGRLLFTTSASGWFTVMEVCGNTTRSDNGDINVRVFAGDFHVATLSENEGGAQPKCVQFPSGLVLPRLTQVRCEGGDGEECWVTGVCSRDCSIP